MSLSSPILAENTIPRTNGHYERLGTVEVEEVLGLIRDPQSSATVLGVEVKTNGLRLETFAAHPPCCSDPACEVKATHFAVERSIKKRADAQPSHWHEWHLNLYGRNGNGQEILLTHDHTVARSLGGADSLENTSTMCVACNQRKGRKEAKAARRLRKAQSIGQPSEQAERTPERLEKDREQAERMLAFVLENRNMGPAQYRVFCEAMGQEDVKRMTARRAERFRGQADHLEMSLQAYLYMRQDHDDHQKALRGPASTDVNEAAPARKKPGGP